MCELTGSKSNSIGLLTGFSSTHKSQLWSPPHFLSPYKLNRNKHPFQGKFSCVSYMQRGPDFQRPWLCFRPLDPWLQILSESKDLLIVCSLYLVCFSVNKSCSLTSSTGARFCLPVPCATVYGASLSSASCPEGQEGCVPALRNSVWLQIKEAATQAHGF